MVAPYSISSEINADAYVSAFRNIHLITPPASYVALKMIIPSPPQSKRGWDKTQPH